ncbi:HD-GYP domain-containing protein [Priestia filamentosa]|uniref:HD-GYP domain-containing protein n=1 Tax=Priestia filamentosa TaxID=1402861 RepID=UPI001C1DEFB0|nr:HD-GYP domain-containing protein [Priestia filamentosa]
MAQHTELYEDYFNDHRLKVTTYLYRIIIIFLGLSCVWNTFFYLFQANFSRASLPSFLICLALLIMMGSLKRYIDFKASIYQHMILIYSVGLLIVVYFQLSYSEAWSFFLLLPLLAGIYGEKKTLVYYSLIGLGLLTFFSIKLPKKNYTADGIDISNRILLYIILSTLSFLVLQMLHLIYRRQVNLVKDSTEATIEEIVNTFVVAVEAKDVYTYGHSERVSQYAVALASSLPDYCEQDLKRIKLSGLLHDVGKINVPEHILMKKGRLFEKEYETVKTHSTSGAQMIERMSRLQRLKAGVLYHHERWDGTGYPSGLKGRDIPLDARVLAIADAFDAMTTTRSYRQGIKFEEAFYRLELAKGTQFDPWLIESLKDVKNRFREIYDGLECGRKQREKRIEGL